MTRANSNAATISEHSYIGEKLSLLAVFAHPEDESFGPAGTLAKYASEGIEVSLVTATRDHPANYPETHMHPGELDARAREPQSRTLELEARTRDQICSCRAFGIRRACLFDFGPGELKKIQPELVIERLVMTIREIQPQVVITFGPEGLAGDVDNQIISAATTTAFRDAGDPTKFPRHFQEGLTTYAPQKLYHCVLPASMVADWGVEGLSSVPDADITTILDVSAYGEAMKNALYCQRHRALDFIRWLTEDRHVQWNSEYYELVESRLNRKSRREKDLFAGLR
jgi:LmbE family N-acetylglucosaminyl deacetylase